MEKLQNAIIINGVVYEFIDDDRSCECTYCDLICQCKEFYGCLCSIIFDDIVGKRFEERTDL